MPYILGIDIGTSFTAAAIAHPHGTQTVAAAPLNLGLHAGTAPSEIFLGRNGEMLVGDAAEGPGLADPSRVARRFSRQIGDVARITVGESSVAPEDLFAALANWVVLRAIKHEGARPDGIIVTHPATWASEKTELVRTAMAKLGVNDVTMMTELEAAAFHYADDGRVGQGEAIAVYDLGGGTFDSAVLRSLGARGFETLGRPDGSERLGGVDFDDAVLRYVVTGLGDVFAGNGRTERRIQVALSRLRRDCVAAKEALSFESEVSVPVFLPGVQAHVRLTRSEFETLIEDSLLRTVSGLCTVLSAPEVPAASIGSVLLVGGSSRIPLATRLLSEQVELPLAPAAAPKASISLGAALAGAKAFAADTHVATTKAEHVAGIPATTAAPPRLPVSVGAAAFVTTDAARGSVPPRQPVHITSTRKRIGVGIAALAAGAATVAALTMTAGTTSQTPRDPAQLTSGTIAGAHRAPGTAPIADAPPTTSSPKPAPSPKASKHPASHSSKAAPREPSRQPSPSQPSPTTHAPATQPGGHTPSPTPTASPRALSGSSPTPTAMPTPTPKPRVSSRPVTDPTPTPRVTSPASPTPTPDPTPTPIPTPTTPAPEPTPTTPAPEPGPTTPAPEPEPTTPAPEPEPEPEPEPTTPAPDPTTPAPDLTPTPPAAEPTPTPSTPLPDPGVLTPILDPTPTPTPLAPDPEPTPPAP